jgi:hypothetical protein
MLLAHFLRDVRLGQPHELGERLIRSAMPNPRRFPPPWTIDEQTESFVVGDEADLLTYDLSSRRLFIGLKVHPAEGTPNV